MLFQRLFFADFTNFLQCIYLENDKPVKYWHIDPLLFRLFLSSKCNKSKINAFYPHCLECLGLQKPKKTNKSRQIDFILWILCLRKMMSHTCIRDLSNVCFDIIFSSNSKKRSSLRDLIWSKIEVARLVCMSINRFFSRSAGKELTADVSFWGKLGCYITYIIIFKKVIKIFIF